MSRPERDKWNRKYLEKTIVSEPAAIVTEYHAMAKPGRALDIAAGTGRHSLFLAERGFQVDAVDVSDVAMNRLTGRDPSIHARCLDLDDWRIPAGTYDLILNIRFLDRRLFPQIIGGLKKRGILIFESYLSGTRSAGTPDMSKDYFLRPNELLHAFLPLRIVHYRESIPADADGGKATAGLVGIKSQIPSF
ncbi:MAG: methyltransferase domain-containing protein [Desulfobacteraceae bacterium]|nr:methyltransferase domain-containing protein [Desulfobacteraceae bacterium]